MCGGHWPRDPLTRSELAAALGRSSRYRHLRTIVAEGNDTLLKPLTWQGDMGLGPVRDGETTFLRLDDVRGWAGIPGLDEAGPTVVAAYLRTYGPATPDRVHDWFGKGLGAKRLAITRWLDQLDEQCEPVTIEGDRVLVLREDLDDLRTTPASTAVRLLPGRDPWVMAPGTSDTRVVPPARREVVSRSANLVVARGVVAGTWTLRGERLDIAWFKESGRVPRTALDQEATAWRSSWTVRSTWRWSSPDPSRSDHSRQAAPRRRTLGLVRRSRVTHEPGRNDGLGRSSPQERGELASRLDAVDESQWTLPTPCAEWDVRALVNHVVGEELWTRPLVDGATIEEVGDRFDGDLLGDDPAAVGRAAATEAVAAVDRRLPEGGTVHLSFGVVPIEEYVQQLSADHLVHSWDLAVATHQELSLDPELVREVSEWFAEREELYRAAGAVGPAVPGDGDPQAALLGAFGRVAPPSQENR